MMKSYLLGIDIGTSACKVAVFDRNGKVLAAASGDYPVYYPHEGWAEQNPEEWWDAVCRATKETIQKADITADEIAGIGIDGQSWSAIPIDREGNVLANTCAADAILLQRASSGTKKIFRRYTQKSTKSFSPTATLHLN